MKLYNSIKRPDNYNRFEEPFVKGEEVVIQEKIDGSNTCIMNDSGKLRLFSRTQEITDCEENFKDFHTFVKDNAETILKHLPDGHFLFGEWLGMAKITYNKKAKQGLMPKYYAFDIAYKIDNMDNEDTIKRYFLHPRESELIVHNMGLNFVPEIDKIELPDLEILLDNYVEQKNSLIDSDCMREGIVVKSIDGKKRMKIVGSQFSEVRQKAFKIKPRENGWLDTYLTPMRIEKFLMKVKEINNLEKISVEDYKIVFRSLDLIAEDIITEEIDLIKKQLSKLIKKNSVNLIKSYLESDENKEEGGD